MESFCVFSGVSAHTHFVLISGAATAYHHIDALLHRTGFFATLLQQAVLEYVHLSPQCCHLFNCVYHLHAHLAARLLGPTSGMARRAQTIHPL